MFLFCLLVFYQSVPSFALGKLPISQPPSSYSYLLLILQTLDPSSPPLETLVYTPLSGSHILLLALTKLYCGKVYCNVLFAFICLELFMLPSSCEMFSKCFENKWTKRRWINDWVPLDSLDQKLWAASVSIYFEKRLTSTFIKASILIPV